MKHGWTEPAIVWAAVVGDSGTLKSPALKVALRPTRKRQHTAIKRHAEAMEHYQDELMRWGKDVAVWKRSKTAGDPPAKPEEPKADRCWCDDVTGEALAVLLLNQWRGLLLVRDELSGWLAGFDRYAQGKGGDVAKWLEMFGGRSMVVDRKSGNPRTVYVPRAAVSVYGCIQPVTLARALGTEHRENGLAARLLLACPPRKPKRWTEADISPDLKRSIAAVFDKLYDLQPANDEEGDAQPVTVPLSAAGKAAWVDFYNAHGQEQAELSGDLSAAWSKLEGYAARLALVVHFVRWAAGDPTLATADQIDAESIAVGVTLSRWFGNEARRTYAILGESDEERDRRWLVELIGRKGGAVTVRELQQTSRLFKTAGETESALDALAEAGVGRWEEQHPSPKGGRPTRIFRLNEPVPSTQPPLNRPPSANETPAGRAGKGFRRRWRYRRWRRESRGLGRSMTADTYAPAGEVMAGLNQRKTTLRYQVEHKMRQIPPSNSCNKPHSEKARETRKAKKQPLQLVLRFGSRLLERVTHFGPNKPMKGVWQGRLTPRTCRMTNGGLPHERLALTCGIMPPEKEPTDGEQTTATQAQR